MWQNQIDRDINCAYRRCFFATILAMAFFFFSCWLNTIIRGTLPPQCFTTAAFLLATYSGWEAHDVLIPLSGRRYFNKYGRHSRMLFLSKVVALISFGFFLLLSLIGIAAMLSFIPPEA